MNVGTQCLPVGSRFGRLTVLEFLYKEHYRCRCDCGVVLVRVRRRLTNQGKTIKSCSWKCSLRMHHPSRRHGMSRTREYNSYRGARDRCVNKKNKEWKNYGGRGIEFKFESFMEFYGVLGPRPDGKTLDRFPDNDGHYEKGNVRWATPTEQAANKKRGS